MELTDSLTALFGETAETLRGSAHRYFMARTVQERGPSGQRRAGRELGWRRGTIRATHVTHCAGEASFAGARRLVHKL